MSDASVPPGTMSILREVLDAWVNRNERKAAKGAGSLTFWRDGMLSQLDIIAKDGPSPAVVKELKQNFESSKDRVDDAIQELRQVRSKIGPTKIGEQLDAILHHHIYGKSGIRDDIERLIHRCEWTDTPDHLLELHKQTVREDAQFIGRQIESFNGEVRRLQRLVRPS
ncbi:MAG: hypothetical protein Q7T45_13490 [Bradyrhizobium sp.]|uniref:hypothetical protein n=1 Tax=Bradyrhizobium sp. TaxID=376 RepID=UPI0027207359|nr:hypothetical protein [Bradyrhizobium sp.]MDO8398826.1 hypothetical protein [Bradyrhizobium sp.]